MVAEGLPKVFKDKRMIQKVLFLFRASPYCARAWWWIPRERALGYPPPHTVAPARWQAEKKQNQKAAVGGKKARLFAGTKTAACGSPTHFIPLSWYG